MNFQVLTLFPERYHSYVESGLPGKAYARGLFKVHPVLLRDFADPGRKGRVDDAPYGGGPGMILQPGPIDRALAALPARYPVVLLTPRGELLKQGLVRRFAGMEGLTLVCGYYEGVDERVARYLVDYQVSIGEFVLGSGDLAALCLIEAVTRLLPGYMGGAESHRVESFEQSEDDDAIRLEYPQYTRPADYRGQTVPDVLLEGHHGKIAEWRLEQSRRITEQRKGDQDVGRK
jgi:tRNA (guanine37-N1)-methyltransferase